MLLALPRNRRLDRARAVGILKRRKLTDRIPAGTPAAADLVRCRLEDLATARRDLGPGIVAGVAVGVRAAAVVGVEGIDPGLGPTFFDHGRVDAVVGCGESEGYGRQGEEDQGGDMHDGEADSASIELWDDVLMNVYRKPGAWERHGERGIHWF